MTIPIPRRLALLIPAAAASAALAQDAAQAGPFIQQAGTELASLVAGATTLEERRRRLVPFLERVVDIDGVARFALGRYWRAASPAQQAEFLALFRQVLANGVAGHLGDYQQGGVKVTTGKPEEREDGIYVPTTIERPGNKPNRVTWMVVRTPSGLQIADVIAEGISLRLTQRSDYAAFLSRNGGEVGTLIAAIKAQLARG